MTSGNIECTGLLVRKVLFILYILTLNFCDALLLLDHGTCIGSLRPKEDSLDTMANLLSRIYGAVTLTRCHDRTGKAHIVMLKEEEP